MAVNLTPIDAEPVGEDIIERLEELLELARKGELSSIAVAYVFRSGAVSRCWSLAPNAPLLLGSVVYLSYELSKWIDRR